MSKKRQRRTEKRARKKAHQKAQKKAKKPSSEGSFGEVVFEQRDEQWWWYLKPGQKTDNVHVAEGDAMRFGPFATRSAAEDQYLAQLQSFVGADDYSDYDKKLFETYTEAHQILRPAFPNEFPGFSDAVALVVQIAPGMRMRMCWNLPTDSLDELGYQGKPLVLADPSVRATNIVMLVRAGSGKLTPRTLLTLGNEVAEAHDRVVWDLFERAGMLDYQQFIITGP